MIKGEFSLMENSVNQEYNVGASETNVMDSVICLQNEEVYSPA